MAIKDKYTVILRQSALPSLPAFDDLHTATSATYNERRNLPIITWLLNRTFTEKYTDLPVSDVVTSGLTLSPSATVNLTGNSSSSTTAPPTVLSLSPNSFKNSTRPNVSS